MDPSSMGAFAYGTKPIPEPEAFVHALGGRVPSRGGGHSKLFCREQLSGLLWPLTMESNRTVASIRILL
jgi:hypothetical protein